MPHCGVGVLVVWLLGVLVVCVALVCLVLVVCCLGVAPCGEVVLVCWWFVA